MHIFWEGEEKGKISTLSPSFFFFSSADAGKKTKCTDDKPRDGIWRGFWEGNGRIWEALFGGQ